MLLANPITVFTSNSYCFVLAQGMRWNGVDFFTPLSPNKTQMSTIYAVLIWWLLLILSTKYTIIV